MRPDFCALSFDRCIASASGVGQPLQLPRLLAAAQRGRLVAVDSNWRGAPADIGLEPAPCAGASTTTTTPPGRWCITLPGKLRIAFEYDQAGRMSKTILPDGSGILTACDTEGRRRAC